MDELHGPHGWQESRSRGSHLGSFALAAVCRPHEVTGGQGQGEVIGRIALFGDLTAYLSSEELTVRW